MLFVYVQLSQYSCVYCWLGLTVWGNTVFYVFSSVFKSVSIIFFVRWDSGMVFLFYVFISVFNSVTIIFFMQWDSGIVQRQGSCLFQ